MPLDVAALEAALPAATILAVAAAPGGLTSASTQVYVARKKRAAPTSVEFWWRPIDPEPVEGGLGHVRRTFWYEGTLEKASPTAAELSGWRSAFPAYFHGYARPFVTGLWAAEVSEIVADLHQGEGPVISVRFRVGFREV